MTLRITPLTPLWTFENFPFLALVRLLLFHRALECIRMHRFEETFCNYCSSSSARQSYTVKMLQNR